MAKQKDVFSKVDRSVLQSIIDLVPSFFFARDKEGRFLLVNDAAARAYGTTPKDMEGKTDAVVDRLIRTNLWRLVAWVGVLIISWLQY